MDMNIVGAYAILLFVVGFVLWFMWNYAGMRGFYIRTFKKNKLRAAYQYMEQNPGVYHMDGGPKLKFYQTHPLFNRMNIHELIELEKIYEKTKGGLNYEQQRQDYGVSSDTRLQELHTPKGISRGKEEVQGAYTPPGRAEYAEVNIGPEFRRYADIGRGYAEDPGRAEGTASAPQSSSVPSGNVEGHEQHRPKPEETGQEPERKQSYFS